MSDDLILKREPREIHPEGQYAAVCLDVIAMGMRVNEFQGKQSVSESCVFVFGTGEVNSKGQEFHVFSEMTVSMNSKAKLPKFLTGWRGKPFTTEEMAAGFKLSSLIGKHALVSLIKKTSALGNDRTEIDTIMPLPKGMPPPVIGRYTRPEFWSQRKAEYAAAYAQFMGRTMRGDAEGSGEEDDDETTPF
jgi:hypothetical protein